MKIAIITDAWYPQTNGVVTTLTRTRECLEQLGHTVLVITPAEFRTIPLPTYPSIRLAVFPNRRVAVMLKNFNPDAVHIATEGPLGFAARRYCVKQRLRFTTAYHTQFPYYIRLRAPIPLSWSYRLLRWFHGCAERTMVPTESQRQELLRWGFRQVVIWSRGVDTQLFRPQDKSFLDDPRPISLFAGRVAIEKNIEAFLRLPLTGTKYVVGDGPDKHKLSAAYPHVRFVGFKYGEELAAYLAAADVFVFPSRTDTFGLVMLEAMACGVPVAAYPVTGPIDVIQHGKTGIVHEDLLEAINQALELDPVSPRQFAEQHSWLAATKQFVTHLAINTQREETVNPWQRLVARLRGIQAD